jgi:hypothetical protein
LVKKEDLERASPGVKALNPHLFDAPTDAASSSVIDPPPSVGAPLFSRGAMNKTERDFALILESMKRRAEILRYEYEGITLRWADMRYTPDFVVFTNVMQMLRQMEVIKPDQFTTVEWSGIKLIEVKGAHVWDRDIVRFKGARAFWPEFQFEMHQKVHGEWRRLH